MLNGLAQIAQLIRSQTRIFDAEALESKIMEFYLGASQYCIIVVSKSTNARRIEVTLVMNIRIFLFIFANLQ